MTIAGIPTSVYLVEGDGYLAIEPQNIRINVRSTPAELPAIVAEARSKLVRQLAATARSTRQPAPFWNSPNMIALTGYRISRTSEREDPTVHLQACLNDYATFAATVLRLDEEVGQPAPPAGPRPTTLRQEFFPTREAVTANVRRPLPFLANGVGIALLAFSDDGKVLLGHRRLESKARPGECDVTVVEGIDANHDSNGSGRIDIYATAIRGCREELGVEISAHNVSILAFGVDTTYYQWNFMGMVDVELTANDIIAQHALHAKDRWEGRLEQLDLDPIAIFGRMQQDKIWDCGLITAYLALSRKCGVRPTREAAEKIFGLPNSKTPWSR